MAKRKKSTEDEPIENTENINDSDDNFGLPEVEYEPINRDVREEEPVIETESAPVYRVEEVTEETVTETYVESEEVGDFKPNEYSFNAEAPPASSAPKVIGIIVVLLALIAGGWWYFMIYQPKQKLEAEKALQEQLEKDAADKKAEATRLADLKRQDDEKRTADSLANAVPKEGTIETLEGPTHRYYVVVASAIDDDLIMDYAKKLSNKGVSSKIIPPFGKSKFFRIAVSEGDTYGDAQTVADGLKSDYEEGAWVIRY